MGRVDGISLGAVAAGAVFTYAGLKGYSIPHTIQDIVTGKSPAGQDQAAPITGAAFVTQGAGIATAAGSAIANDALQYQGAGYVWGGAPARGVGNWDCSSFANWTVGHDEGLAIPGYPAGTYDGTAHGPVTLEWLIWSGCVTIGHQGSAAQAGDLCVWQTHMGIATGGGQMISAQNPQGGTRVSGIDGFITGELLYVRRLRAAAGAVTGGPSLGRKR